MSRMADLVMSKEGILLMIEAPSTVLVDLEVDLSLHMLSLKVHMRLADNGGPPMTSHHHEEVGASCKQVWGVEGQLVFRSQGPKLLTVVEPNGIGSQMLNKDGDLGELHIEIWQVLKHSRRCWKICKLVEFHLEDKVSFWGGSNDRFPIHGTYQRNRE